MIYLVNEKTKEHAVVPFAMAGDEMWGYVEADADGWIHDDGEGECPMPEGADVEIKAIDGTGSFRRMEKASADLWATHDITAYRPIRSVEDQAVEEMLDVISNSDLPGTRYSLPTAACRALYRAGFRKP